MKNKLILLSFCLFFFVKEINNFSLPEGRKLAIIQGYNEKSEVDAFMQKLDDIDHALDSFQKNLDGAQVSTYKRIDDLIEKMSSKSSIDTLNDYAKKKVMENKLKDTIKAAFERKMQKVEKAMNLKNKLEKLKMDNSPINVDNISKPITLENTNDYTNLINVLQQMKKQGKSVTINLNSGGVTPLEEKQDKLPEQREEIRPDNLDSQESVDLLKNKPVQTNEDIIDNE